MIRKLPATILDGESLSGEVNTGGHRLIGVEFPAGFSGSLLTFQANVSGSFQNLYSDAGDEIALVVASPDSVVGIDTQRNELEAVRFAYKMKVRAGSAGTPSPQTGDQIVVLLLEE